MIRRLSLAVLAMSFLSASVGADDVRKVLFKTDAKLTALTRSTASSRRASRRCTR